MSDRPQDNYDVYFVVRKVDRGFDWIGGMTAPGIEVAFAHGTPEEAEQYRQFIARREGLAPDDFEVIRFSRAEDR